ncbi:MAG: IS200/IS605 family transposase [Thermoanaerobaculia bacterium]
MPHSYDNLLTHIVFATKNRRPFIDAALEARLFPYLGGIVRQLDGKSYVINGVEDHVHLLAELPPTIAVAEAIGKVKGSSTYWIHQSFPEQAQFAWQRGYAAFSVSKSKSQQSPDISKARKSITRNSRFRMNGSSFSGATGLRSMRNTCGRDLSPA